MKVALVDGFVGSVQLRNGEVCVFDDRKRKESIGIESLSKTRFIVTSPHGWLSLDALRFAEGAGASLAFIDRFGRLQYSLVPHAPVSARARIAQMRCYLHEPTRLRVAKTIVRARLDSVRISKSVEGARTVKELVNLEGASVGQYWNDFKRKIPERFEFGSRRGKNRLDNHDAITCVNSALNLANSVIESHARRAVVMTGLVPEVGFLHSSAHEGKEPLVYDLEEIFRVEAENAVLDYVQSARKSYFGRRPDLTVRLKPEEAAKLVEAVEERLRGGKVLDRTREFASGLVRRAAAIDR